MRPKKIVLIVIDSLRRDHLGCYRYKRDTSPNIDVLARGGILFKNAFSVSPNTVSSIASIFTSKYPSNHSIGFNPDEKLNPELDRTLAAVLKENNYKTASFSGSSDLFGLNSGFDLFEDGPERRDCQVINKQIFNWLDENYKEDFFLFVHYFDLNGPYLNSGSYKNTFVEDAFYGNAEYLNNISDKEPAFNSLPRSNILNPVLDVENNLISFENDVRYYKAQYDGCIRNLDENIKDLIEKLKVLKIYEDALIIITSDHGVAFGENNVFFYDGLSVTLDQIAVPLILKPHKGWNIKSGIINVPVNTIDIMPTILSLCEINFDDLGMDGHSLGKIITNEDKVLKERILTSENESQYALIDPSGLIEFKKKDTRNSTFYPYIPILIDSINAKKYYWDTDNEYNLNLPFDQYQRYKIIADIVNKFRNSNEIFNILEVGASFEGNLKKFLPNDSIYFLDKEYPPEYSIKNNYIVGDFTKMNISDTYDFVVSLDVYEHILPNARKRFIDSLLNVSKIASIIAAPFDTPGVHEHEVIANEVYKLSHGYEHVWLHEHIQNGLPSLSYTLELIKESGFDFVVIPNGYLPRWFEMISIYLISDGMPEFSRSVEELYEFYNKNFYEYDNVVPAYRQVIVVTKMDFISDLKDIFAKNPDSDTNFDRKYSVLQGFLRKFKEIYDINKYKELMEKRAKNTELNKQVTGLKDQVTILKDQVTGLKDQVTGLNFDIKDRNEKIANLEVQLKEKNANLDFSNFELRCIRTSFTWRTVMKFDRLRVFLKTYNEEIFGIKSFLCCKMPNFVYKQYENKLKKYIPSFVFRYFENLRIAFQMHIGNSTRKSDPKLMLGWNKQINTMKKKAKIILFVDRNIPTFDRDAGSFIVYQYLNVLSKLGYNIIFWPYDLKNIEPYSSDIKNNKIEIVAGNISYYEFLFEFGKKIDYIFLSRPEIAHEYIEISKKFSSAKIIYIGHDLHFIREKRGEEITSKKSSYQYTKKIEENIMRNADIALFFSDKEVDIINHEFEGINVKVMPWIQELHIKEAELNSERKEMLFLGGFKHLPNLDAMLWFKDEIFPLVKKAIPSAHMTIIGSDPTEELLKMENDDCTITGYVEESKLSDILKKARVFVAPLRYGAGFKGKIAKAMSFGVPVVTTTIGSEGIGLEDGKTAMVTNDPGEFAEKIIHLYKEDSIWQNMSANAADHLRNNFSFENAKNKMKEFLK